MGKHFFNKLLNADDAPNVLDAAELIDLRNMRFGTSESGELGGLENIKGTLQKYAVARAVNNVTTPPIYCIGSTANEGGRYVVWFTHSPADVNNPVWDAIWLYDLHGGQGYKVMDSSVINLNFNVANLIQARVVNDCLYWTDNYNAPRMLHLGTAMSIFSGSAPIAPMFNAAGTTWTEDDIALYKKPYGIAPNIARIQSLDIATNRIQYDSFKFAVRYIYYNGEMSVLSPWSKATKLNAPGDNTNLVSVYLNTSEKIPLNVREVQFCIIHSNGKGFVFGTRHATDIVNSTPAFIYHNNGSGALSMLFSNNALGSAIDDASLYEPFHSVPYQVRTLEIARNRLFLANYLEGRDAPASTSLTFSQNTASGNGNQPLIKLIHSQCYNATYNIAVSVYGVFLDSTLAPTDTGEGMYILMSTINNATTNVDVNQNPRVFPAYPGLPAPPASCNMSDLTFAGGWQDQVGRYIANYYNSTYYPMPIFTDQPTTLAITGVTSGSTPNPIQFKSGGEYQLGIVFFDAAQRKCGVVTNDSLRMNLGFRNFQNTSRVPSVAWSLAQPAVGATEIPDWAAYYAIVRTLNLKTRWFVQSASPLLYFKKDATTGDWVSATTYDDTIQAIGLSIDTLVQSGLGYNFTQGDVCTIVKSDNTTTPPLSVLEMKGKYIMVSAYNFGVLDANNFIYEIYTPYQMVDSEPYYEIGSVYAISNPGQATRAYSSISGEILGDCAVLQRNTASSYSYVCEAMSNNDKFWDRWDTDAGRINLVITAKGSYWNKTGCRFSDVFIPGTESNGLSSFSALNQQSLPVELGEVMRLQLTSKAQSEGSVMLGIGKVETCSIYLGEGQLMDTGGNAALIRAVGVIGQVNVLKGSLGTLHPESVAVRKGRVFWLDVLNGVIAAYAENGLFEQSTYKLRRAARLACQKIAAGAQVSIPGGLDTFHGEYLLSMPQTEVGAPLGQLEDYEGVNYPYDFYDGVAKVWVAKVDHDRFQGAYDFSAEYFVSVGEGLFSFKNGALWEHNVGAFDTIYGQTVKPSLAFVENGDPDSIVKVFDALSLEANLTPSWTHIRTEALEDTPYWQSSDLVAGDWKQLEGVRYAPIYRDRLSPNVAGSAEEKMLKGDTMRGQWAKIKMEFTTGGSRLVVRFVNVIYRKSKGHLNI